MKLEKLDNRVTLEIIVLDRSDIYPKDWQKDHEYYCVWGYRPWDLRKRPFVQLIADQDLPLYAGEHTRVSGEYINRDQPRNPPLLFLDSVYEDPELVIKRDQTVFMMDPEASRTPNASYATCVKIPVNNTMLILGIPILAFGKVITDHRLEPAATVTKIDPPKSNRRGYLLYANLPNTEQPVLKPSFAERLASAS